MKSPQQQIFDACFMVSHGLGYRTFDYSPATGTSYPFVHIGEQFDFDRANKTAVHGLVIQRIHLYHDYKKRGEITTMMDAIKREIRKLKNTPNFYISIKDIKSQTLQDNTTAQSLIHGIVEVEIKFN